MFVFLLIIILFFFNFKKQLRKNYKYSYQHYLIKKLVRALIKPPNTFNENVYDNVCKKNSFKRY